jgi:hypothetical protein
MSLGRRDIPGIENGDPGAGVNAPVAALMLKPLVFPELKLPNRERNSALPAECCMVSRGKCGVEGKWPARTLPHTYPKQTYKPEWHGEVAPEVDHTAGCNLPYSTQLA